MTIWITKISEAISLIDIASLVCSHFIGLIKFHYKNYLLFKTTQPIYKLLRTYFDHFTLSRLQ